MVSYFCNIDLNSQSVWNTFTIIKSENKRRKKIGCIDQRLGGRCIRVLLCPRCVQPLSHRGRCLPSGNDVAAARDNNLNSCHIFFMLPFLRLPLPVRFFFHFSPPFPPLPPAPTPSLYLGSLMVTLLSDCYISSCGEIGSRRPVSHHYANDGQFNFSRSEGEFLIRVRQSSQDREREGERQRDWKREFWWQGEKGRWREPWERTYIPSCFNSVGLRRL